MEVLVCAFAVIAVIFAVIVGSLINKTRRMESDYTQSFNSLKERCSALESEQSALKKRHSSLEEEYIALEKSHSFLEEKHSALVKRCGCLEELHSDLEKRHSSLEERHIALIKRFGSLEEMHAALEKAHIEARKQIDSNRSEIADLKRVTQALEKKIDFYLNIEDASANLNVSEDAEERAERLEEVVQQILNEECLGSSSADEGLSSMAGPETTGQMPVLDHEQLFARNAMEKTSDNFFITGKAGTGKSFLLDIFRRTTTKSNLVLAPTGIAALNVSGATLHSTFGFYNLVNLDVNEISDKTIRLKSEKRLILQQVETIIIDEISMVRADTFDKIDKILKVLNRNNRPFGGKQILLFGDLFQLPPIAQSQVSAFLADKYGGIYFFLSHAYKNGSFHFVELTINHRQKNDALYFEILNHIRDGQVTVSDIDTLNKRVITDESAYDRFTTLLPTKAEVERVNREHLSRLDSKEYTYKAEIVLDKYPDKKHTLEKSFPFAESLRLRKGALIMMVANDPEHRWVNGTLGIVQNLSDDCIYVAINKRTYEIHPFKFTEQEATYMNGKIVYEDVLAVVQYPLVLAYAITIHKSQGQTYQNIVCDIDKCFESGQVYVALSRCATLNGLHLRKAISPANIHVDHDVVAFYHSQASHMLQTGNP